MWLAVHAHEILMPSNLVILNILGIVSGTRNQASHLINTACLLCAQAQWIKLLIVRKYTNSYRRTLICVHMHIMQLPFYKLSILLK